uniref:Rho GTPase-activating protein n=1 Tax=Schistosoma mansoni TaxID=6183 RepID=A0A5K4FAY1_SCHMA
MVFEKTGKVTISVVGYPGSGTDVRQHVGKSCLINRFMAPYRFNENHLSILSLSDYDSEVICSSHWLYWGDSSVNVNGCKLHVRVIEQCDFVDDHLFQPLFEPRTYAERCLDFKITLHSRKLCYVCKEQLGHESAFPQVFLEPTTLYVDVFVCVYDMSLCGPSALQQAAFFCHVITRLSSLKFPVVVATSKHDMSVSSQASTLFKDTLSGFKKHWVKNMCVVETSSLLNVNVKTVFQCAAVFGHHKRANKYKLHTGLLRYSLRKSPNKRKPFPMCFGKSVWSSVRWVQYGTSLCDTNVHSTSRESPNVRHVSYFPPLVQPLTFPKQHNKLRIPERIILPQMIGVNHPNIPIANPNSPLEMKTYQMNASPFPDTHFSENSTSVQDITLPKISDVCDLSVLLTPPPPLLLPGPCSSSSFEPINSSSIETRKSVALPTKCPGLSHHIPPGNPFVKIYVRGQTETSSYVAAAIRDLCPLEFYIDKNGRQFRVTVLSNSPKSLPSQTSILLNSLPFYSDPPNRRPNGLTIQPVHISLTASQMSAFSAPNNSLLGNNFSTTADDNHNNSKNCSPVVDSVQENLTLTPFSVDNSMPPSSSQSFKANHLNTSTEYCVYLFIYKNINELLNCYELIKHESPISTVQKPIKVLAYICCSNCNTLEERNVILSGLVVSSRFRIPYLAVNSESLAMFLDNLLHLTTNTQIGKDQTTYTSNSNNSFIDWRSFISLDYLSILTEFICLSENFMDKLITEDKFQFVGLLTALILSNCNVVSGCTDLHSTNRELFFVPSTINCEDPQSYCKCKKNSSCFYVQFVQLDEVIESVLCQSPTFSTAYSPRALLIHYSSSSWSEVGIDIENSLSKLCSAFNLNTFSEYKFIPVILLVAFHSGSSQQIPVEAEGIVHGLKLIQRLAQDYSCPLLLSPSEYEPVKVQFRKNSISSGVSTECESDHTNSFFHLNMCENIQSIKDSAKFSLGFLSVSRSDDVRAELYKRVFEGEFSGWYSSFEMTKNLSDNSVCPNIIANNNDNNNFSNTYTSKFSTSSKSHIEKPQVALYSQNVNSVCSSVLHNPPNDVITLPWLPVSPTDAFSFQSSRSLPTTTHANIIRKLDNHRQLSRSNILSSTECGILPSTLCEQMCQVSQAGVFCSLCPQSYPTSVPLPSINSSVEEYYAELPKVTQSVNLELESRRPHPNRPKRPHPHTDSAHSHSPSPLLSNEQNLLPATTAVDQSITDLCSKDELFHINDHQTLDNGSTVYAEVNDAFVYKTLPYCSSSGFIPTKLSSHVDHYELTDSVQQLNNLTLYPNLSYSPYTSNICDNTHVNGSPVLNNTSEMHHSNSSRLNPLSNILSQYKVSADTFGRTSLQFNRRLTNLPALPSNEISISISTHSDSNFSSLPFCWMPTQAIPSILCSSYSNNCSTSLCSWSTCRQHPFTAVNFNRFSRVPNVSASDLQYAPNIFPLKSSTFLGPLTPIEFPCESLPVSQLNQKKKSTCVVDSTVTNISPVTSDFSNHRKRFPRNILSSAIKRYNIWSRYMLNNSRNSKT